MAKSEYGQGVLKGIAGVKSMFVDYAVKNPGSLDNTVNIGALIGWLTTYEEGVKKELEKLEAEDE